MRRLARAIQARILSILNLGFSKEGIRIRTPFNGKVSNASTTGRRAKALSILAQIVRPKADLKKGAGRSRRRERCGLRRCRLSRGCRSLSRGRSRLSRGRGSLSSWRGSFSGRRGSLSRRRGSLSSRRGGFSG